MTVAGQRNRGRTPFLLALVLVSAGCDRGEPSCAEVEQNVARITHDADARLMADLSMDPSKDPRTFVPMFGDFAKEVDGKCRAGTLDRRTRDCLYAARTGMDIDRCAGR